MAFVPLQLLSRPHHNTRSRYNTPRCCTTSEAPTSDPLQSTVTRLQSLSNTLFDRFFSPLLSCSVVQRKWQNTGGNYILSPSLPPKAVLHFLGGAFFAAAPHILYRTLLERLCSRGYVIVATPYDIQFNHLELTAQVSECWEKVESDLALQYGPLPVIGLGHSAGCLFHSIAGSLFDETSPKAANIFVSFNNRRAQDAIPMYAQLVQPSANLLVTGVELLPKELRKGLEELPQNLDALVEGYLFTPQRVRENVLPSLKESRQLVNQIWPLLKQVTESEGVREFYPEPEEVQKAVKKMYAVDETLVVKFGGDSLDDSEELVRVLREGGSGVSLVELAGSHLTPLLQDAPDLGRDSLGMSILQEGVNALGLRELSRLEVVIDEWIEKGIREERF